MTPTVLPPSDCTLSAPPAVPSDLTISPPRALGSEAFEEEVRVLLRSRLMMCHFAAAVVGLGLFTAILAGDADRAGFGAGPVVGGVVNGLQLLVGVVGYRFLLCRPAATLRTLRVVELTIFGVAFSAFATAKIIAFLSAAGTPGAPQTSTVVVNYAGLISNLPFYFLLIYYGVLIPNTRARVMCVAVGMSAVPLLATVLAGAIHPPFRPYTADLFAHTTLGVFLSSLAAVVGSSRIRVLQKQAFEARREASAVGPYRLKRLLGKGGMGEVYLGEHRLLRRPCAVKLIHPARASDPAAVARFTREVQAITALSHPNTVRVYDYGQGDDGTFYYVMEYLDGRTLDAVVKESGPLPTTRAVVLLRQVCGALAEAHAARLVHRDLKPGNIFVATMGGQPDVVKLLDFGLVRDLGGEAESGELTQLGAVMGTPAFMSPEQAAGEPVDARADIYGLGAVAFFAVTGRPPFDHPSVGRLLAAQLTETPPRADAVNPTVPAALADVIARCLAKSPADRYQTAAELGEALAATVGTA